MAKYRAATLQFLGAAGTVTGSKHLITAPNKSTFLLDCGLFQGPKALRQRNWRSPSFSVRNLTSIVLSHAHIDHSGYLPVMIKNGYQRKIFCTDATADLLHELLLDAAHLQEEEARFANQKGYSRHKPALPLFTHEDVQRTLKLLEVKRFGKEFTITDGVTGLFQAAGHILGAATVQCQIKKGSKVRRLAFSGDLGRYDAPILRDPTPIRHADVLLLESTYGGRIHPLDVDLQLARIVHDVVKRRGTLVVPAFAVGRTQELIYRLRCLEIKGLIPAVPIFVDSPMANQVTKIYSEHAEEFDLQMLQAAVGNQEIFSSSQLRFVRSVEESKSLNQKDGPMIIIAGSGMATGGRVLHHMVRRLPSERNMVLLVGYQAQGTRGRDLQEGAKRVRIHGYEVAVEARIEVLDGLSAHAGQDEIMRWLKEFHAAPEQVYLVHGEAQSALALKEKIESTLNWRVQVAQDREKVEI